MKGKTAVAAILAMGLAGCASRTTLTVNTVPTGAFLTEVGTGRALGIAPITITYDGEILWKQVDSNGCFTVAGIEARWVSGATAVLNPLKGCAGIVQHYNISLSRDPAAPGLDKDMEFAVKAQSLQAQQQQAQATQDAALMSAWAAGQQSAPTTCTTSSTGSSINTTCR